MMVVNDINTFEILKAGKLVFAESSVEKMNEIFA